MKASFPASKLPPKPSSSWGIFDKPAKRPNFPFPLEIEIDPVNFLDAPSNVTSRCPNCGSFYIPGTSDCPICKPGSLLSILGGKSCLTFLNRLPNPIPPSSFVLFLFEVGFSSDSLLEIITNLKYQLSDPSFGPNFFFGFGFVSTVITVFQGNEQNIHFGVLSNSVSPLPFLLPLSQHFSILSIAAKAASHMAPATSNDSTAFLSNLHKVVSGYHFSNICYFFHTSFTPPQNIAPFDANLHLIHIADEPSAKLKALTSSCISSYMQAKSFTADVAHALSARILHSVKVPMKITLKASKGIALSFDEQPFVRVSCDKDLTRLVLSQVGEKSEIKGEVLVTKAYTESEVFAIQAVAEAIDVPPIVMDCVWGRAADDQSFNESKSVPQQ